jgi:uncharacterized protein
MSPNRLLLLLVVSSLGAPLLASGFYGPPLSGHSSASTPKSSSQPSSSTSAPSSLPADSTVTTLQNLSSQPTPAASTPASDNTPLPIPSATYGNLDDLAQSRAATPDQIKEYISLTHAVQQTRQLMQTMTKGMENNAASYLPQSFWDDFHSGLDKVDLQAALIPAYQKYFSQQDMEQILAFYRTPAGQHFASVQPLIGSVSEDTIRRVTSELGNQVATRHASEINAAKRQYEAAQQAAPGDDATHAPRRVSAGDSTAPQNTAARQESPAK